MTPAPNNVWCPLRSPSPRPKGRQQRPIVSHSRSGGPLRKHLGLWVRNGPRKVEFVSQGGSEKDNGGRRCRWNPTVGAPPRSPDSRGRRSPARGWRLNLPIEGPRARRSIDRGAIGPRPGGAPLDQSIERPWRAGSGGQGGLRPRGRQSQSIERPRGLRPSGREVSITEPPSSLTTNVPPTGHENTTKKTRERSE